MSSCRGDVCSALNCTNNKKKVPHLSFFRVPKNSERSKIWISNSGRTDLLSKSVEYLNLNIKFCAIHFDSSQFMNNMKNKLIWNAIPTLFDLEISSAEKTKPGSKLTLPRFNIGPAIKLKSGSRPIKHTLVKTSSTSTEFVKNNGSTVKFDSPNFRTTVMLVNKVNGNNCEDSTSAYSTASNNNGVTDNDLHKNISPTIFPNLIYSCSARNCGSDQKESPNLLFFTLPNDRERSNKWLYNSGLMALQNYDLKLLRNKLRFCALHFEDSQFTNVQKNQLVENALPTIFEIPSKTDSFVLRSHYNPADQHIIVSETVIPNVSNNTLDDICSNNNINSDEVLTTCENYDFNNSQYDSFITNTEDINEVDDSCINNVGHEQKSQIAIVLSDHNTNNRSSTVLRDNVHQCFRHEKDIQNKNIYVSCNEKLVLEQHITSDNDDCGALLKRTVPFSKLIKKYFQCSAKDCNSSQIVTPNLLFFKVPQDGERSKLWLENSKRTDLFNNSLEFLHNNVKFCSLHFDNKQFTDAEKTDLKHMAVPTLFNVPNEIETEIQNQVVDTNSTLIKLSKQIGNNKINKTTTETKLTQPKLVSYSGGRHDHETVETILDSNNIIDLKHKKSQSVTVSRFNASEKNYINNLKTELRRKNKKISILLKKQIELKKLLSNPEKMFDKLQGNKKNNINNDKKLLKHLLSKYLTKEALSIILSQIKAPLGNKCGNRWDIITKQFALQMHQHTPKGYQYLSRYINLPSIRTLQTFGKEIGNNSMRESGLTEAFSSECPTTKSKLPADHNYNKDKETKGRSEKDNTFNIGIIEHKNNSVAQNLVKKRKKCLKVDNTKFSLRKGKNFENGQILSEISQSNNKITSHEEFGANHFDCIISSGFYNLPIFLEETPEAALYLTGQSVSSDVPVEFYPDIKLKISENINYLEENNKEIGLSSGNLANGSQKHDKSHQARKHKSNITKSKQFLRALEDVRLGKLGFTKAAKLYEVNRSTLWAEYKRRGYPAKRGLKLEK